MNWLAVSTSADVPSVAVKKANDEIVVKFNNDGLNHSKTIMRLIDSALVSAGITIDDIDKLAVDIGPGSFTGVRIGVSIMNAIAAVKKLPLYAVSSLTALCNAYNSKDVCALLDARNENVYGILKLNNKIYEPYALMIEEALCLCKTDMLFVGSGADAYSCEILNKASSARFAESGRYVFASDILDFAVGVGKTQVSEAVPLYLRASQAERLFKEK